MPAIEVPADISSTSLGPGAQDTRAILRWLSPIDFRAKERYLSQSSCQLWGSFLSNPKCQNWVRQYQNWSPKERWELCFYGGPGSGKTRLSALFAHNLRARLETANVAVVCIFVEYIDERKLSVETLLGIILRQLCAQDHSYGVSHEIQEMYEIVAGKTISITELETLLATILAKIERAYLIVDGIDRLSQNVQRSLRSMLSHVPTRNVYLMSSSCPGPWPTRETKCDSCGQEYIQVWWHCDICNNGEYDMCQVCKDEGAVCPESAEESHKMYEPYERRELLLITDQDDLSDYVLWELDRETEEKPLSQKVFFHKSMSTRLAKKLDRAPHVRDMIPKVIAEKATGSIMFAKLYVDSLILKQKLDEVIDVLDRIPENFAAFFDAILEQVKDQPSADRTLALKVLSLVTRGNICDRLSFAEISDAIRLKDMMQTSADLDTDLRTEIEMMKILEVTKGQILIEDTQEHHLKLFSPLFGTYLVESCEDISSYNKVDMASLCLEYLNSIEFAKPCMDFVSLKARQTRHPFLVYASHYWGEHLTATRRVDSSLWTMVKQQLNDKDRVAACIEAAWYSPVMTNSSRWEIPPGSDRLHICAWFGIDTVLLDIIKESNEIPSFTVDIQDPVYRQTPLIFACRRNHAESVKILLNSGASLVGESGRMALFSAIYEGHSKMVDFLLTKCDDLVINNIKPQGDGRTALMLAIERAENREGLNIIQTLLGHRNIDIEKRDTKGRTALSHAAAGMSFRVMKLLLEVSNIDVNSPDDNGRTTVSYAAEKSSDRVLGMLLDAPGIKVNAVDNHGRTALHFAVENYRSDNVQTLLGSKLTTNVDANTLDRDGGRSALSICVTSGDIDIMRILLEHGVDLSWTQSNGGNLLHLACSEEGSGREVIELLCHRGVRMDRPDNGGWLPLHHACRWEETEVADALIDLGADLSCQTSTGLTPYEIAWQYNNVETMELLQDKAAEKGLSALALASPDKVPLWALVKRGMMDTLEAAIKAGIDPDEAEYVTGNTALHWAVLENQLDILEHFLQRNLIAVDKLNLVGHTPLRTAAIDGNVYAVELLLRYKAEVDLADQWERTALSVAQDRQFQETFGEIAIALMEAGAKLIASGVDLKSLLLLAIDMEKPNVVKSLIDAGVDIWERDDKGDSPLQHAQRTGHKDIWELLSEARHMRE